MQTAVIILFIGVIIFLSHYLAGVASRTKIPDVLWLFLIGILIGPVFCLIDIKDFGIVGPIFTSVTLVFVLFESGTDLGFLSLRKSLASAMRITGFNFLITTLIVGVLGHLLLNLPVLQSLLLGSILGGTSSAMVTTLTKQYKMEEDSSTVLILESALSDVFTLAIPFALMDMIRAKEVSVGIVSGQLVSSLVMAVIIGIGSAFGWSVLVSRLTVLQTTKFASPAFVFIVYGIAELLGFSGPIAALIFGITIGNLDLMLPAVLEKYVSQPATNLTTEEKSFYSEIVFLLRTFFFIYIGLSVKMDTLEIFFAGLLITAVLYLARMPLVAISFKKETSVKDASFAAVCIPKGLGCAILASLPLQMGIEGGEIIQNISFTIILLTTVITSLMMFLIDRTQVASFYSMFLSRFKGEAKETSQ
jgi:cell volume regulation protein A